MNLKVLKVLRKSFFYLGYAMGFIFIFPLVYFITSIVRLVRALWPSPPTCHNCGSPTCPANYPRADRKCPNWRKRNRKHKRRSFIGRP